MTPKLGADSYATPGRDCGRGAGWVEPRRIAVSLAMSSLMTESVIGHAGPVSDHSNPVIDHKVLTEAISRTKRTSTLAGHVRFQRTPRVQRVASRKSALGSGGTVWLYTKG
jgi:hypothetical protein